MERREQVMASLRKTGLIAGLVLGLGLPAMADPRPKGSNSMPDVWLHFAIAVTSLIPVFAPSRRPLRLRTSS
jgi:hypothetical protein